MAEGHKTSSDERVWNMVNFTRKENYLKISA